MKIILFIGIFIIFPISLLNAQKKYLISEFSSFEVIKITKDTISFEELLKESSLIIFYNNYSCFDCVKKIISSMKKEKIDSISIISRTGNSTINRREMLSFISKKINVKSVFFDSHDSIDDWPPVDVKGGLFGFFNIVKTPAILLNVDSNVRFYSFKELEKFHFSLTKLSEEKH